MAKLLSLMALMQAFVVMERRLCMVLNNNDALTSRRVSLQVIVVSLGFLLQTAFHTLACWLPCNCWRTTSGQKRTE